MQVFSIRIDGRFQSYVDELSNEERQVRSALYLERRRAQLPLLPVWTPVPVYLRTPDKPAAPFHAPPVTGRFAFSEIILADSVMKGMMDETGEILPMQVTETGEKIYVFDSLPKGVADGVLDEGRTVSNHGYVYHYAFHRDKLPPGGMFVVPNSSHVFVVHSGDLAPEKDFIQWYRARGYAGLTFQEQMVTDPPQAAPRPTRPVRTKR